MIKIKKEVQIKVIDLAEEYKNKDISVRWAIISDLTETQIKSTFKEKIAPYSPFVILSNDMGDAIYSFHKNNAKFKWRYLEKEICGLSEDVISAYADKTYYDNDNDNTMLRIFHKKILNNALKLLTEKQRRRIILYYSGISERKIAEMENVNQKSVHESIDRAEKRLKKAKLK